MTVAGDHARGGPPETSGATGFITVCVIHAGPGRVWQRTLRLPGGSTARQALAASGFARDHPACPPDTLAVGVFGQICSLDHRLADADRLEIYLPLDFDPMESRRRRAAHRQAGPAASAKPARRRAKAG